LIYHALELKDHVMTSFDLVHGFAARQRHLAAGDQLRGGRAPSRGLLNLTA